MKESPAIRQVLIVEDDRAHAEAIRQSLAAGEFFLEIRVAGTLKDFRSSVASSLPDIVIMDLNLPDGSALDILVHPPESNSFPVLVLTSPGGEHMALEAIKAGALDYLVKNAELFSDMPRIIDRSLREWKLLKGRMHAEEKAKLVNEQFQAVFDHIQAGIFIVDQDSRTIENANLTAAEMCGVSIDHIIGKACSSYICHSVKGQCPVTDSRQGKKSDECILIAADGRKIPVLKTAVPVKIGGKDYLLESFIDISRRKQIEDDLYSSNKKLQKSMAEYKHAQEQMLRNERMNVLTQIVSGVAHDFNNILMPVLGLSDLLLTHPGELKDKKELKKMLRVINRSAKAGAEIVRRLREFYKPDETRETMPVDLDYLVRKAIELTTPSWKSGAQAEGRHIRIITRISKVPLITGNETQLREVLTNLIINAVDAMPDGGKITITVAKKGLQSIVKVADTGLGMSRETCKRCFEPFFSTKGTHGSGLGLSLCHGIITRHGGKIKIQSKPGEGTTVQISLPFIIHPVHSKPHSLENIRPLKVLLAEDKHESVDLLTRYLTREGHTVESVPDGSKALEKIKAGQFDLLITDQAMPLMSGDELAQAAKKICPGIVVIMLTGFMDFMQLTSERQAGIDLLLRKPLTKNELIDALASLFID